MKKVITLWFLVLSIKVLGQAPTITSFTPEFGCEGTIVTITGSNFNGATAVSFGGTPAASFNIVNANTITAELGVRNTGAITITGPGGTGTSSSNFRFGSGFGTYAYVGSSNKISVINTATNMVTANIPIASTTGISVSPDGSKVYIANRNDNNVTIINTSTNTVMATIPITGPNVIRVSNDGSKVYVGSSIGSPPNNYATNYVYVINTASNTLTATIPIGNTLAWGINVSPDGSKIYVVDISFLYTINAITNTVISTISYGFGNDICVSPDGSKLYITEDASETVGVINTADNNIITSIPVGNDPYGICITLDGSRLYVANRFSNSVSIINTATNTVTGTIPVGIAPQGISISPDGSKVYVANSGSGNVSVINTAINTVSATILLGTTSRFLGNFISNNVFAPCLIPVIRSFTPKAAAKDTIVTLTGNYFTGTTAVSFGGTPASSFTVVNDTTIKAVVGSGTSGNVVVKTAGGAGSLAGFTFIPAPTITSFTPNLAPINTTITISGTNFTGATAVSFGGTPASSFKVVNSTTITAVVAAGTSGSVSVQTPGGIATLNGFTFAGVPTITSISPVAAAAGSTVTITGTNFTGLTSVTFGGVSASSFNVVNTTTITAVVGTGSSGNVSVTTPGGTATFNGFTFIPAPVINSFSSIAASGTTVTINGFNFIGTTAVSFGGVPATSFTVVNANTINAVVGAGASGNIIVTTPGGTATSSGIFTYIPPPSITSFTPVDGYTGTTVTIIGTNFSGVSSVRFGNVSASSFRFISETQITAVVANGSGGNITITTPGGTASLGGFTYYPAPTITSFTPTSAANRSTVTIKGTTFVGVTSVRFGNTPAYSYTVTDSNTIVAIVGPSFSGNVSVTTPGGTANLAGFTYLPSPPTITSFTPSTACGSGITVTINGVNFTGTNSVLIGGVSTPFRFVSDTVITFTTTDLTNSGAITVVKPQGNNSSATNFTLGSASANLLPNPNPFQLCNGTPRKLQTNQPDIFNLTCSNGQSGNNITISSPGNYTLTATDQFGCISNSNFTVTNFTNCGGYLEIDANPIMNYFDTLRVRVLVKNGVNVFSVFAYLNYNNSQLRLVGNQAGNYLGTNIITQPPVITSGRIDFGMTKLSGDPGSNGDGVVYEFNFVLNQIPSTVPFSEIRTNIFTTTLSLSNISIYNAQGIQPPSFTAISLLNKVITCRYFVPVWPGDLNCDKRVTVADILPIGYFYGSNGPARPNGSLAWQAQPSALWGFDNTNKNSSAYRTFADGNADGVINLADQVSIGFNLAKFYLRTAQPGTIPLRQSEFPSNLPAVNVNMPSTIIQSNALPTTEQVTLTIGSPTYPLNKLFGLAFDIYFDPAYVNPSNITTDFNGSTFGTQGVDYIKIEDRSGINTGKLSVAFTRYNNSTITGNGGTLMKVNFPLLNNAKEGWFKVTAIPVDCNDNLGNKLNVTGSSDSLQIVMATSVSDQNIINKKQYWNFNPNPTNGNVQISYLLSNPKKVTFELLNSEGKLIMTHNVQLPSGAGSFNLNLEKEKTLSSGIYYLRAIDIEKNTVRKVVLSK